MFDFGSIGTSVLGNVAGRVVGRLFGDGRENNVSGQWQANADLQREFAQHGIRWRVEDAKAAGVHPLFALGAQVSPASPIYMDGGGDRGTWSGFGQDISRAIDAGRTAGERAATKLDELQLERAQLENELLRSRIARENSAQQGPAMPGSVEGIAPIVPVEQVPLARVAADPGRPSKEAGFIPDYTYARTPTGLAIVPGKDVKERIEDMNVQEWLWAIRNNIIPHIDSSRHYPDHKLYPPPAGHVWKWHHASGEFRPVPGAYLD